VSVVNHKVDVICSGKRVPHWHSYSVSSDVRQPADAFSLSTAFSREAWEILRPDAEVVILIDDTRILTGYIDNVDKMPSESGTQITIDGRDKSGRLIDDAAPIGNYGGLPIRDFALAMVSPVFDDVEFVNIDNRTRTRNRRAAQSERVRGELGAAPIQPLPPYRPFETPKERVARLRLEAAGFQVVDRTALLSRQQKRALEIKTKERLKKRKAMPGQSRWQMLQTFLDDLGLIAWSRADGQKLFIGVPDQSQSPQYFFIQTDEPSRETNCSIRVRKSCSNLYSRYMTLAAAKGDARNYGSKVTGLKGITFDNPANTVDGTGNRLLRPKTLIVQRGRSKHAQDAQSQVELEKAEREADSFVVTVTAPGHSQLYAGDVPAFYSVDSVARIIDEKTETAGDFYVTSCTYDKEADSGTKTVLECVPVGTVIV
jgi:prophage tail gpP-like protein